MISRLGDLGPIVSKFNNASSSGPFSKFQTKLHHLLHRIDQILGDHYERSDLSASVLSLLQEIRNKAEQYERTSAVPPLLQVFNVVSSTPVTTT